MELNILHVGMPVAVAVLSDHSLTKPQDTRLLEMPGEEIIPVLRKVELDIILFSSQSRTTSGVVLPAITNLVKQLKAMAFEHINDGQQRVAALPGQNFRDTLVQSLSDRFFLNNLNVAGEETVTCETVPFYLLASFIDPRFRDLSFLSEAERGKHLWTLPSLPAISDVAVTTEPEILPTPKKKSKSEVAMEELQGKSSHSSQESTEEFHKRKVEKEIYQLHSKATMGSLEDPLQWWKENKKCYPLVRNCATVLAALLMSVPSVQHLSQLLLMHCYF